MHNQSSKTHYLLLIALFLVLGTRLEPAFSQNGNGNGNGSSSNEELIVRKVRFVGNKFATNKKLDNIVRTRTNREFLGVPGFTPWYWFWIMTKRVGEPPSYLDRELVNRDIERIKAYYESQGYFEVRIDTTIIPFGDNKAEVSYIIREGSPSQIRSVAYTGLPNFEGVPELTAQFYRQSIFNGRSLNDSTFAVNKRMTYESLNAERDRIITFLKNNGFASVQKDSVKAWIKRDALSPTTLDILFEMNPGQIYQFGDIHINLSGPESITAFDEADTLKGFPYTLHGKSIFLKKDASSQTKFKLLKDQITIKPGDVFSNEQYLRMVNQFQNLNMMNVRRFALNAEGGLPDYSKLELPILIDLQTNAKHRVSTNVFGIQRYGFGAGAGISYTNNNVFGEAEQLELALNGSFEYAATRSINELLQSREASIGYSVPKLNFPFGALDNQPYFLSSRTLYQLAFAQVNQLNFDINANIRFNLRYDVNHTRTLSSTLDFFEVEWVDASANPSFINALNNNPNLTPLQVSIILEDFRPQINSQLRYTLRQINTNVIKRNYGYYAEGSIEIGGNVPYLIDRYIADPNDVSGDIPSFGISDARLSYSRYAKIVFDFRRYISLSERTVLAYRTYTGVALPYGVTRTIPLTRRFFAGGSNDIRGWAPFTLGPGRNQDRQTNAGNGGDIKIAGFSEVRQELFRDFLASTWELAVFTDAGNVWNGPRNPIAEGRFNFNEFYKEIAVSSGLGLRLDFQYVVVRFDMSYRVHDLERGWFNNNQPIWSFGIGHSF